MTTLIICLFIACLLPYLTKLPVAIAMAKQPGGYDNKLPRIQQAALTEFGARAVAAHYNSFESLIIYAAAILTAIALQKTDEIIQVLAIFYLFARCVYTLLYLLNWSTLRSTIWALSLISSLSIIWRCLP